MTLSRQRKMAGVLILVLLVGAGSILLVTRFQNPGEKEKKTDSMSAKSDRDHASSTEVTDGQVATGPGDDMRMLNTEFMQHAASEFERTTLLAARKALEKSGRPDLRNGPSARERTLAHQKGMQIPEDELPTLSTEDLVGKVAGSSFYIMMIMNPQPDGGLSAFSRSYNGVAALLAREDAGKALLKEYRGMYNEIPGRLAGGDLAGRVQDGKFAFRFTVIETMLSSDDVLVHTSRNEMKRMISLVLDALDARRKYDATLAEPIYGEATLEWIAMPIAKCLRRLGDPAYELYATGKADSGLFTSRPLTYEEAREVIAMGRQYLLTRSSSR